MPNDHETFCLRDFVDSAPPPTTTTMQSNSMSALCRPAPMEDIQYYSRKCKAGTYELLEPWEAFTVIGPTDGNANLWLARVIIPRLRLVVIVRDDEREFGLRYRMRTSEARVIAYVASAGPKRRVVYYPPTSADISTPPSIGALYSKLDTSPYNLKGDGIYILPCLSEGMRLLGKMARTIRGESDAHPQLLVKSRHVSFPKTEMNEKKSQKNENANAKPPVKDDEDKHQTEDKGEDEQNGTCD